MTAAKPHDHQARDACFVEAGEELLLMCVVCEWVAFEGLE